LKVLAVVGARPQFIKHAALSQALRATAGVEEVLVHTGQHYDENMSEVFFREMEIAEPRHNLGVGSGGHGAQTGAMLAQLEEVLLEERPDWTLIYGDTNSTLAAALASVKLHIPVAHVEAGLRSHDLRQPEEVNRLCADQVSTLLFAPTEGAAAQLHREGFARHRIRQVGDVMYDAALHFAQVAERHSTVLERAGVERGGFVLTTIHRPENTDDPRRLRNLVMALVALSRDLPVVFPMHPRTRGRLGPLIEELLAAPGVRVLPPASYLDMVMLEKYAALVASDSGGVPKEAFFYRVPSVILREVAVWDELVELGWTRTIPADDVQALVRVMRSAIGTRGAEAAPYGDGRSGERIVADLIGCRVGVRTGPASRMAPVGA
jgi:UDP-GlcNAc3NAcA epimerase